MPRKHPRQHRRPGALKALPTSDAPQTPETRTHTFDSYHFHVIAHALLAGAEVSGGSLYHVLQAFREHVPDAHLLWHIEEETRSAWVKHHHTWLREEYGDDWRAQVTTTPNPHGNCEECLHPLGFYDQLFGDEIPGDIDDCECGCHQTPAADVPDDEGGA